MRRSVLIAALLMAASAQAQQVEASQLTPEGLANLQSLLRQIENGAMGPDIVGTHVTYSFQGLGSDGAIRVDLQRKDGGRWSVVIIEPPHNLLKKVSRKMAFFPDDDVPREVVDRFTTLAGNIFGTSDLWPSNVEDNDFLRTRPVGRWAVLVGIFFLLVSVAAGVAVVFRARPASPDQMLVSDQRPAT